MASSVTLISDSFENRYMQLVCTQRKGTDKSYIDWTLSSVGGDVNYYATGPTTVTINGTQVYYKARVAWQDEVFPAKRGSVSGTIEVEHDAVGNKTISVSMSTIIYYGASRVKTYSTNWTLDPIPRGATILTAPSTFTNASLPTITYTNPLGNTASKVEVCIADASGIIVLAPYRALSKTGSSYTFTADDMKALNAKFGSKDKKLDVMFVIRTTTADGKVYDDGEPSTYQMEETDDTKPSVSIACSVYNPTSFPSALANTYVQGKSSVEVDVTANGKYGATISHFTLSVDGQNQMSFGLSEKESDSAFFITDAITSKGTVVVTVGATDSRGFTGKAEGEISVLEYGKPLVIPLGSESAILCYRSDGNGKQVGSSTSVWVKAKRSYYTLGGNNGCSLQWRRRLSTETWGSQSWLSLIPSENTTTDEYNALISGTVFELQKSYSIQIRAVDMLGEYDVKEFEIPTQDVALHLGKGGKNVSIGEYCDYSEEYTFRSAWKAILEKGIVDGTDTGWVAISPYVRYRYKLGHVTIVGISNEDIELTADAYTYVGTVPAEYAPTTQIPIVYHGMGGSVSQQAGRVETNGQILLFNKAAGISYWAFFVTYPT